jgi:hypothetical protein
MKYNLGDKVKIKDTLEGCWKANSEGKMNKYCGKEAIINTVFSCYYSLDIDDGEWAWTDEMLEDYTDEELTFKKLYYSPIKEITLNWNSEEKFINGLIKNREDLIFIDQDVCDIFKYKNLPIIATYLLDVYDYCSKLKEKK